MFAHHASRILALVVASAAALGGGEAAADCKKLSGKFFLQPVSGPGCLSTVGVCAALEYRGDLKGTSDFTGSSLIPTADTPTTEVVLLTGDNVIHTPEGDLFTKDAIALKTTGENEFAEVDVAVGGTGVWAGATGTITSTGTFDPVAGGTGRYEGEICKP